MLHSGITELVDREKRLNIRISDEEGAMLHALAEQAGISASDFLRLYIRKAYAVAFPEKSPPKKKR